jgi:tetratricopeptide (TPR) repeat protein
MVFLLSGCETTEQQKMRQLNDDGVRLFRQGDYQGARESFELALKQTPDDANLMYNVGQCHDRGGDWPKAEKFYRQCLSKADNHGDCRHALEVVLYKTGRQEEAGRMIQEWLAREPKLAAPYAEDGWRLRQQGAYPQAMGRLQQALLIDPHNVRALTELGILYEQSQPERALDLYKRAQRQDPNQPDIADRIKQLHKQNVGRPLPD